MVMGGRRVLVSGIGGELGLAVASLLEAEDWVGALSGIDVDPPVDACIGRSSTGFTPVSTTESSTPWCSSTHTSWCTSVCGSPTPVRRPAKRDADG